MSGATQDKEEQWAQWLTTGGADNLFMSYPSDEELATKLNDIFIGEGVITAAGVHRDRERYHQRPRRGDEREEKLASPTKYVIYNKARQLNVEEALAEILDNIFDNFERNPKRPQQLAVKLTVYPRTETREGEIVIQENSGGIPSSRIVPLIQLGASERAEGGIGAWGEGFKIAVFALGQEIEVFSSVVDEPPVAIHFPKGWLDPNHRLWTQWKVSIFNVQRQAPPPGTTIIHIHHLPSSVLASFGFGAEDNRAAEVCKQMATNFGEIYAEKYHKLVDAGYDVSIRITIDTTSHTVSFLEPVAARLKRNLAFLPWLRPIEWTRSFKEEGGTAQLDLKVYAGITAHFNYSPRYAAQLQEPGVEMWGNGRLFTLKGRITDSSVGWGYTYGGGGGRNPTSNASSRRLMIVALFEATDSRVIPWAAPVKNDYNRRSEFYAEIQETMARTIKIFKDGTRLLEFVLIAFSHAWGTYSIDQKLEVLFKDVAGISDPFKNDFATSRFGKKLLAWEPSLKFAPLGNDISNPTVHLVNQVDAPYLQNLAKAASATKNSPEDRVEFLKIIFQHLEEQAKLEEMMNLQPDEELAL